MFSLILFVVFSVVLGWAGLCMVLVAFGQVVAFVNAIFGGDDPKPFFSEWWKAFTFH